MKIKSLQLKNFKRFTDLTLQDIPATAKLVLLIGANGSGKSSVFDAFEAVSSGSGKGRHITDDYILEKTSASHWTFNSRIETSVRVSSPGERMEDSISLGNAISKIANAGKPLVVICISQAKNTSYKHEQFSYRRSKC